MSSPQSEFAPTPREDDPDLARQMVTYAEPMQDELVVAEGAMLTEGIRLASFVDKMTMMNRPDHPKTDDGIPIITVKDYPDIIGISAVNKHLETRSFFANRETRWVQMLTAGAHYRAMLGRHDYMQGVDETEKNNLIDMIAISWKNRTLAGQAPSYSKAELFPDRIAIAALIKASPEATAEAHQLFSGTYSKPARELLRKAGIIER